MGLYSGMSDEARRTRDAWIALRCQVGEREGFELLVSTMERPLFYYVLKLVGREDAAADVVQEVWFKAFRTIRRLREPEALRTWLYRIARGTALNRIRGDVARERAEGTYSEVDAAETESEAFDSMRAAEIHRALDRIEPRQREVLVLLFLEGLCVREIASVVGCPEGTVKSRLHSARKALREVLGHA